MKKLFASMIAVLYFTASSGVVLNMHYCMGKLSSVKVDNFSGQTCKCGPQKSKKSCCGDEVKVLKVDNVHQAATAVIAPNVSQAVLSTSFSFVDLLKLPSQQISRPLSNSPPIDFGVDLNILHSVFLI